MTICWCSLSKAHIHLDTDEGCGWSVKGERFWVSSCSPGLAKVSFYGVYIYNLGQVRLFPDDVANGLNTVFGSHLTSNPQNKNYGSHPKWGLEDKTRLFGLLGGIERLKYIDIQFQCWVVCPSIPDVGINCCSAGIGMTEQILHLSQGRSFSQG
jgi:hypothetical protein